MFFKRFTSSKHGCASYLIADAPSRVAAVVDPTDGAKRYRADAINAGCQIRYALFTRSCLVQIERLREWRSLGVSTYAPSQCEIAEDGATVRDGDVIQVGNMRLSVCSAPQCLPADVVLLVYDLSESDLHPMAMLAGDMLLSRPEATDSLQSRDDDHLGKRQERTLGPYESCGQKTH